MYEFILITQMITGWFKIRQDNKNHDRDFQIKANTKTIQFFLKQHSYAKLR